MSTSHKNNQNIQFLLSYSFVRHLVTHLAHLLILLLCSASLDSLFSLDPSSFLDPCSNCWLVFRTEVILMKFRERPMHRLDGPEIFSVLHTSLLFLPIQYYVKNVFLFHCEIVQCRQCNIWINSIAFKGSNDISDEIEAFSTSQSLSEKFTP